MGRTQPLDSNRFQSLLDPLSWLLLRLRVALDDGPPARPPRWVRIAQARVHEKGMAARNIAEAGVTAWIELVSAVHELSMDLIELLDPITAGKADLERRLQDLKKALSHPALKAKIPGLPEIDATLTGVDQVVDVLLTGVDLFPDRNDAETLGQQVYNLICIRPTQRPNQLLAGRLPPTVDIVGTGKLRLLQWAFDLPWPLHGLGPEERPEQRTVNVRRLGSRWLVEGRNEDQSPYGRAIWVDGGVGVRSVPVFELYYNEAETDERARVADLTGLHGILEGLGYFAGPVRPDLRNQWHEALSDALECFQAVNDLPRSRELDQATLNRLYHLDSGTITAKRALPLDTDRWARIPSPPPLPPEEILVEVTREVPVVIWDPYPIVGGVSGEFNLVNADANSPAHEGIVPAQDPVAAQDAPLAQMESRTSYRWYRCGVTPAGGKVAFPPGVLRGWIQHNGEEDPFGGGKISPGFVALESRVFREKAGYDGGIRSEGGTPNGPFFFCARHQAPSVAGRVGASPNPIWEPRTLPTGSLVGMYQWVDLAPLAAICEPGEIVTIRARAMMRVQVPESGETAQARIVLALVDRAGWEKERYATVFDPKAVIDKVESGWFPEDEPSRLVGWRQSMKRGWAGQATVLEHWVERSAPPINWQVDESPPALYLGLHAQGFGGEDIGANVDGVVLTWERGRSMSELEEE